MTTLKDRPNDALLVIDVQNGVVGGAHERDAVVANVGSLVEKARREQIAVVWVQHSDGQLAKGSDDWRIVPELTPGDAEPLVEKSYGDAFEDTTLETVLSGLGVGRLVVVGAETDACIRSTLHGAFVRGYDASLVSDAHTTGDKTAWGAPPPDQVIAHTNLYWTYTTAPGRTAGTVETKGVDFASALSGRGNTYVPAAAGDAEGRADAMARFQRVRAGLFGEHLGSWENFGDDRAQRTPRSPNPPRYGAPRSACAPRQTQVPVLCPEGDRQTSRPSSN
jgi:Isochorismatase family